MPCCGSGDHQARVPQGMGSSEQKFAERASNETLYFYQVLDKCLAETRVGISLKP